MIYIKLKKGMAKCGESKQEAVSDGYKYYIGKPCKRSHKKEMDNGKLALGVRFTASGNCYTCHHQSSRKAANKKLYGEGKGSTHRKRIEDLQLARELGIDVSELE